MLYMENNTPVYSRTTEMQIGKCKYIVTSHYNENGRETADDKFLRYVQNRVSDKIKDAENRLTSEI